LIDDPVPGRINKKKVDDQENGHPEKGAVKKYPEKFK
jgi:hypothetical protein